MKRRARTVLVFLLLLLPISVEAADEHGHRHTTDLFESETYFPDAANLGTGALRIALIPGALLKRAGITIVVRKAPAFQILAQVARGGSGAVALGPDASRDPRDVVEFVFPKDVDLSVAHVVMVTFSTWRVSGVSFDGLSLSIQRPATPPRSPGRDA